MSRIDLNYINADHLIKMLSEPLTKENVDWLIDSIRDISKEDYANAMGYISKYDNEWDKLEGTDVSPLKKQIENYDLNLQIIAKTLKERIEK